MKKHKKHKPHNPDWKPQFLSVLSETGSIGAACRESGVSRTTYLKERKENPLFDIQFKDAMRTAIDALEERAREMAMVDGNTQLMITMLKAHRPKKYNRELYLKKEEQKQQNVNVSVYIPENGRDLPAPTQSPPANLPPPADSYPSSPHGQEGEKKVQ